MCGMMVRWCLLVLCCLLPTARTFNVDTKNVVRYRGDQGSMFGFSVALHRERGGSWVIIGAPEAQTRQPGVVRGGAVYRCDVHQEDACQDIPFDITGNNNNSVGQQIDQKSEQWFGASVSSSGETGVILACAPRYVWFSTVKNNRRDPVGTCYVAQNLFSEFSEYSPCRTRNWGYHRQGSCQAGLGADVAKDGKRLYVGAPGSWYWQGQIYEIASSFKMPWESPDYTKIQELNMIDYESGNRHFGGLNLPAGEGQLFAQNPAKRPEVLATSEGPAEDDDSYLGYSVAAGDFEGRGEGGVAVGMPRGARLLGKVVLYSLNLTLLQNITGEQLGSYFSYSITVGDIDGDGLDDLIVGAPLYTDLSNNDGKYETGRVYIYYQKPDITDDGYYVRYNRFHSRDGKNSRCRFGLSVASLGDINKDGFGDFAVGAPYDGEEGRGAVYIFHGSKTGVRETHSQIIRGEDISPPISTFGFSIAGGLDLDENRYPDLVVGGYESDTAVFLRSRPVIKMVDARIVYMSTTKHIGLDEESCTLRDLTRVPCVTLQACLKYSGIAVDPYVDVDIGITLDSKKSKGPRMFFLNEEGRSVMNQTITLTLGQLECKTYTVYIKPGIKDKLTALEAELRYNLREGTRRVARSLAPVLDATVSNIQRDSLFIQNNCGPDNVCIPDLRLVTKQSVDKYLLGSKERLTLDVRVENRGEDAFEATYNLHLPNGMNYINIDRLDRETDIPVYCSSPTPATNMTLKCEIGNPLPQGKMVRFKVLLQPFYREGMPSRYEFSSFVNSTNPEDGSSTIDNGANFIVPIWVETDLILSGSSNPSEVHYQIKNYTSAEINHESEIGPQVHHLYVVRNKGPSNIIEADTFILWPSYTLSGDHLVYLLEQPETNGNVKCERVENVNELGIQLDSRKKSFFEGQRGEYEGGRGQGRWKATEEERRKQAMEYEESGNGYRKRIGGSSSASSSSQSSSSSGGSSSSAWTEEKSSSSSSSSSSATRVSGGRQESGSGRQQSGGGSRQSSTATVTGTVVGGGRQSSGSSETTSSGRQSSGSSETASSGRQSSGSTVTASSGRQASGSTVTSSSGRQSSGSSVSSSSGRQSGESSFSASGGRDEETRRRQGGSSSTAGGSGKVTYEEGSYRGSSGGAVESGDTHFKWTREEEERRQDAERRRQQGISSAEGDYRTRTRGRVNDSATNKFNEDAWKLYGQNEFRTVSFDVSNTGSGAGTAASPRPAGEVSLGRNGISTAGDSRTTASGSRGGFRSEQEEQERRRYEEEIARRAGSKTAAEHEAERRRYEEELERRAESAERHYEEEVQRRKQEEEMLRRQDEERRRAYEEERRRYEEETRKRYEAELARRGGGSRTQTYEERQRWSASTEEERRRIEAEAARVAGAAGKTYTSSYETNSSWDSANGGRPRTDSRWSVNDNGVVQSGTSSGHDEEYERRLMQERQRRIQEARGREGEESGGYSRYYNSSYSSERRTSGAREGVDPDLGYVRNVQGDDPSAAQVGKAGSRRGSSSSNLLSSTDKVAKAHERYRRHQPLIPRFVRSLVDDQDDLVASFTCGATNCTLIRCTVGPLQRDQEASIAIRGRVWIRTLQKIGYHKEVMLSSLIVSRVTKLPHIGETHNAKAERHEVLTEVMPQDVPIRPEIVPLWVVVLSACAGAVILLLLIWALYACGFFKRNRPTESAEKQPLNWNGYHNGDEAL